MTHKRNQMRHHFAESVKKGDLGEAWFLENYHIKGLTKLDTRSLVGDYRAPDGRIIEVKTEFYDLARTPNFFFEHYSNLEKKTMGGPWRARDQGADILVHFFFHDKVYFEFENLPALLETIDLVLLTGTQHAKHADGSQVTRKAFKEHRVLNPSHVTTGFALPRHHFELLYTRYPK